MAAVNPAVSAQLGQLTQGLQALSGLGVNLPGVTGGGTTGAAAPAANAAGTATTAQVVQLVGVNGAGQQIAVIKDNAQDLYRLATPTGKPEKLTVVEVDDKGVQMAPKTLLFDEQGNNVRNFEVAARQTVKVDLDRRQGIATGINNLSRVVAGRQERLKALTEALAQDSNESGSTNQVDIQRLVQEQQVTEHLSNMNHKIYESVQNAIAPWLR